jgi:hypothetical protein
MSARNALGVEDAFGRLVQWCATDSACALNGEDVGAVFDAVSVSHPEVRPLVAQLMSAGRDPRFGWPAIAGLLAQTAQGDPAAVQRLVATVAATTGTRAVEDPSLLAGKVGLMRGVLCSDFQSEPDYAPLGALSSLVITEAPRFGALKFWDSGDVTACVGWPRDATNPPHHLRVGPHPNVLVTNNVHDPATPLTSALAVWRQIPEASLLTADADGHQTLPVSRCAFEVQLRFLDDPASTPRFTTCAS